MLDLINAERRSAGLNELVLEQNLNAAAERHSSWMLAVDVFSHTGIGNSSPTERMADAGFDFFGGWISAENIAVQTERGEEGYFDDVEDLHEALMNSPGHRANILDGSLEYIGIGIEIGDFTYDGGYNGFSVMVTQNFARTNGFVDLDLGIIRSNTLFGTSADDSFTVDHVDDVIVESAGGGIDEVFSSVDFALRDSGRNVENLDLTGVDDISGTGNSLNNTIIGNGGDNILNGAWGDDVLYGDSGNDVFEDDQGADRMIGGTGDDIYFVDDLGDRVVEEAFEGLDLVIASVSFSLRNQSQHVEYLFLTGSASLAATGNSLNNVIAGNDGHNVLNGAWGADALFGGLGNDTFRDDGGSDAMYGGLGHDTYYVNHVADEVFEEVSEGRDHVFSSITFSLRDKGANIETLTLTGNANLSGTGNGHVNAVTGNAGNNWLNGAWGNDTLVGAEGNDTFQDDHGADRMVGGTGNDSYYIDNEGDTVVERAGEGYDLVRSYIDFSLRGQSQHIERLSLAGTDDVSAVGNGLDNFISGNAGNNRLNGGWGNDTLIGGSGDDIFQDDLGADRMSGGGGNDTYWVDNFGDTVEDVLDGGNDHVNASVSFSLRNNSQHIETLALIGSADISGIGNGQNNSIVGNSGDNFLDGAWGDDTLEGGDGNDRLQDEKGNDHLTGGEGADIFVFVGDFEQDTISDFNISEIGEQIDLSSVDTIETFDDLQSNHLSQDGENAIIDDGNGNTITLTNVSISDLQSDHFIF
ncbi:MAG: CAP domain-containing protein [Pseudomonadota bacterium]